MEYKPLTPRQRLLVYKTLLKVVCKDPAVDNGMCAYLSFLLDKDKRLPKGWKWLGGCDKMKTLVELKAKKSRSTLYWAPLTSEGWETRIRWIEKAISEVESQLKPKKHARK